MKVKDSRETANGRPGDILELTPRGFAHDGRAVARSGGTNGPAVFVRGGLPEQRVLVRLEKVGKRLAEGVVQEVLEPSPLERPAPCRHAGECGGCPWQRLPYAEQLRWKEERVRDALVRVGRLTLPDGLVRAVLPSPAPEMAPGACAGAISPASGEWGYRNKMEFAFTAGPDGKTRLGLRRAASRDVVEVTDCLLQSPRAMRVLEAWRVLCGNAGLSAWTGPQEKGRILRFAVIREPGHVPGENCLAELITGPVSRPEAEAVRSLGQKLLDGSLGVSGFVHSVRASASDVARGEKTAALLGRTHLEEHLRLDAHSEPVRLRFSHSSFFQVNTRAAELLYNTAIRLAFPEAGRCRSGAASPVSAGRAGACWDVCCGVGGLALAMAPCCESVLGLESMPEAVSMARKNAAGFPRCRFMVGDASRLGEYFRRYGVPELLCVNPPRSGLAGETVQAVLRARPRRLLLVSCDPATLARDMGMLAQAYAPLAVQPVDLFPQTPHVETAALLVAGPGGPQSARAS
jgi:23S rRNA (uracil1939-C5)-methyltransferase